MSARREAVCGLVAVLLVACFTVGAQNHNGPIRITTAGGTYYSVGYQVGSMMSDIITRRLAFGDYVSCWSWLQNNTGAQFVNQSLFNATVSVYPELIEELHGVADGSGVSFAEIWMMNIVDELYDFQRSTGDRSEHFSFTHPKARYQRGVPVGMTQCTDVFTNELSTPAWGHNEDSGIYDVNNTYMVRARIYNNDSAEGVLLEEFVAYTYAGSIAGKAWGWNYHGLLFSCNALFPREPNFADSMALPRQIHNRVALRARSIDEAIAYTTAIPSVSGFSINIGYRSQNFSRNRTVPFEYATYRNVEVWPMGTRSVTDIYPRRNSSIPAEYANKLPQAPHHFFHVNDYEVLNVSYIVDGSSVDRLARLHELPIPLNMTDVRRMLGDTENPVHPIYRHGTEGGYTLATVLFDFDRGAILVFNSNPKNTTHSMLFSMHHANW